MRPCCSLSRDSCTTGRGLGGASTLTGCPALPCPGVLPCHITSSRKSSLMPPSLPFGLLLCAVFAAQLPSVIGAHWIITTHMFITCTFIKDQLTVYFYFVLFLEDAMAPHYNFHFPRVPSFSIYSQRCSAPDSDTKTCCPLSHICHMKIPQQSENSASRVLTN